MKIAVLIVPGTKVIMWHVADNEQYNVIPDLSNQAWYNIIAPNIVENSIKIEADTASLILMIELNNEHEYTTLLAASKKIKLWMKNG